MSWSRLQVLGLGVLSSRVWSREVWGRNGEGARAKQEACISPLAEFRGGHRGYSSSSQHGRAPEADPLAIYC